MIKQPLYCVIESTVQTMNDGRFHFIVKGRCKHFDWGGIVDTRKEAEEKVQELEKMADLPCDDWSCHRHPYYKA